MLFFAGIPAGIIIEKRGCQFTALLGAILYTLSFLGSYFAPCIEVLYITLGIGTGFSHGLLTVVVFTIVSYYFDKKLGMAIGFTQAGVGIGLFIFSAVNGYLLATYGLQGTFLILTALAGNTIPLAMLMKQPESHTTQTSKNVEALHDDSSKEYMCEKQSLLADNEKQSLIPDNTKQSLGGQPCIKDGEKQSYHKDIDGERDHHNSICCDRHSFLYTIGLDLFTNRYYTLLTVANTLITLPHNIVPTILPDHIKWNGGKKFQLYIANKKQCLFDLLGSNMSTITFLA